VAKGIKEIIREIMQVSDKDFAYSISAYEYYNRAWENIRAAKKRKHRLFYAALEARFLIEAVLREYLITVRGINEPREYSHKYKPSSIIREIKAVEPHLAQKIRFANILFESEGVTNAIPIPDMDIFRIHYESLNKYLHTQYVPKYLVDRDWWHNFEREVVSILEFMCPYFDKPKVRVTCNEAGLKLFERFRLGKLSPAALLEIAQKNSFGDEKIEILCRQFPQE
jgi:hypothetical protein